MGKIVSVYKNIDIWKISVNFGIKLASDFNKVLFEYKNREKAIVEARKIAKLYNAILKVANKNSKIDNDETSLE